MPATLSHLLNAPAIGVLLLVGRVSHAIYRSIKSETTAGYGSLSQQPCVE